MLRNAITLAGSAFLVSFLVFLSNKNFFVALMYSVIYNKLSATSTKKGFPVPCKFTPPNNTQ